MARALDHIVWPARDLDALAGAFRRLGFTVGRRNRHPWGTVNHIIQFDGCFLELLGLADEYRPLADGDPALPFAGVCERFLVDVPAGAAMLALSSRDALADARLLMQQGIGEGRTLPFSRSAQAPDGSDRTVAFTIAFADVPGLGAFVCEQHRPENFWNPAAQLHANGALGVAALGLSTPEPDASEAALRSFAAADGRGDLILADGCRISLSGNLPGRPAFAAIDRVDIRVPDLGPVRQLLSDGTAFKDDGTLVSVDPTPHGSTSLRFLTAVQPA
jgi:hypothetical protein